jgi:hypothetical protein
LAVAGSIVAELGGEVEKLSERIFVCTLIEKSAWIDEKSRPPHLPSYHSTKIRITYEMPN